MADVKQQKQTDFSAGDSSAPQTVVQTNVDIPSAGVHQTFVQDDEQVGVVSWVVPCQGSVWLGGLVVWLFGWYS